MAYFATKKTLSDALTDTSVPSFLFGCTPPREGTDFFKVVQSCESFTRRSAVLAADGYIVYDIQDEKGRTSMERPFPFRKTVDPSLYASLFPPASGKQCVVYKCVVSESREQFQQWLDDATRLPPDSSSSPSLRRKRTLLGRLGSSYPSSEAADKGTPTPTPTPTPAGTHHGGHNALVLVGAPTSKGEYGGISLKEAADIVNAKKGVTFGCVAIAERHSEARGYKEHLNMVRKQSYGAKFFITQGIFDGTSVVRLIQDYAELCKSLDMPTRKVILTFAPCGREKTMSFIKWLGMNVPPEVEARIFSKKATHPLADGERDTGPVEESCKVLKEVFSEVLDGVRGHGVTLGVNVESLSIFKEEIDAAHDLFQALQKMLLDDRGDNWAVKWYDVKRGGSAYDDVVVMEPQSLVIPKTYLLLLGGFAGFMGFLAGRQYSAIGEARR